MTWPRGRSSRQGHWRYLAYIDPVNLRAIFHAKTFLCNTRNLCCILKRTSVHTSKIVSAATHVYPVRGPLKWFYATLLSYEYTYAARKCYGRFMQPGPDPKLASIMYGFSNPKRINCSEIKSLGTREEATSSPGSYPRQYFPTFWKVEKSLGTRLRIKGGWGRFKTQNTIRKQSSTLLGFRMGLQI